MKKIVVAGQLEKDKIAKLVTEIAGDKATVVIKGDIEAAMDMKSNIFDYYLGACNTGGGGAIAIAIAILGSEKCITLSMPGKICSKEEIESFVKDNKKVYGFTAQHVDQIIPVLIPILLNQ